MATKKATTATTTATATPNNKAKKANAISAEELRILILENLNHDTVLAGREGLPTAELKERVGVTDKDVLLPVIRKMVQDKEIEVKGNVVIALVTLEVEETGDGLDDLFGDDEPETPEVEEVEQEIEQPTETTPTKVGKGKAKADPAPELPLVEEDPEELVYAVQVHNGEEYVEVFQDKDETATRKIWKGQVKEYPDQDVRLIEGVITGEGETEDEFLWEEKRVLEATHSEVTPDEVEEEIVVDAVDDDFDEPEVVTPAKGKAKASAKAETKVAKVSYEPINKLDKDALELRLNEAEQAVQLLIENGLDLGAELVERAAGKCRRRILELDAK